MNEKNLALFGLTTGIALSSIVTSGAMTPTHAATLFTDATSFNNNLQSGFYLNDFESLPTGDTTVISQSFSGNGFSYDINTSNTVSGIFTNSLWVNGANGGMSQALSTSLDGTEMVINFTSGNVTAVGGNFFRTDLAPNPIAGNLTISLSDGTSTSFSSTTSAATIPFRGFMTTGNTFITSLTLAAFTATSDEFNTLDNLYVGQAQASTAVPEPFTVIGTLVGGTAAVRMRKRLQAKQKV